MVLILLIVILVCLVLVLKPCAVQVPQEGEELKPVSSRWFSGCKRLMLSLLAANVLLPVAIWGASKVKCLDDVCSYWCEALMLLAIVLCLGAFAWGVVRPRVYHDGVCRFGIGRKIGMLGVSLLLFLTMMIGGTVASFVCTIPAIVTIELPEFSRGEFKRRHALYVAERLVPEGGRDIRMLWNRGAILGGAFAEFRCSCTQEELQAFARKNGYAFQGESITRNSCPEPWPANMPKDVDFIQGTWGRYSRGTDGPNAAYPEKFLAYSCRYPSCRGYSFLYDIEKQVLYGNWASN